MCMCNYNGYVATGVPDILYIVRFYKEIHIESSKKKYCIFGEDIFEAG